MSGDGRKRKVGTVGRFIRERREELGFTRAELAKRVGCGTGMVCMVENGVAKFPFKRCLIYAIALQVPVQEMLRLAIAEKFPDVLPYVKFEGAECVSKAP